MYKDLQNAQTHVTDLQALQNSIRNILLTRRGSVPGKPRFGSDLYKIVFSQMDSLTESMARNYVREALSEYEDRITVQNISFKSVPEYNRLVIDIAFKYKDSEFTTAEGTTSVSVNV